MKKTTKFWSLPVIATIGIGIPVTTGFILKVIYPSLSLLFVFLALIITGILGFVLVETLRNKPSDSESDENS